MRSSLPTSVDTIDAATADSAPTTPASTTSVDGSQASASSAYRRLTLDPHRQRCRQTVPARACLPSIVSGPAGNLDQTTSQRGSSEASPCARFVDARLVLGPEDTHRVHSPDPSDIRISIDATVARECTRPDSQRANQGTLFWADAESSSP